MFDDPKQTPSEPSEPQASFGVEGELPPATPAKPATNVPKPPFSGKAKPPFSAPPKKIGKDVTPQKKSGRFLITIGMTLIGLFVMFVVLMVLVIAGGGQNSPVLKSLGINAEGIKSFLLTIINLSFGFLALLFFIFIVIGVFRWLFAKRGDKEARGRGIRMFLLGLIPMVLIMFLWLVLFNFINKIEIVSAIGKEEIIVTDPTDVSNLTAPVEVTFSSENIVKTIQREKGTIVSTQWDLNGDGTYETNTTEYTVSSLYTNKGATNVGLEVTVQGEPKPRTYTYLLNIPNAVFGAEPATGTAPLTVQFDASGLVPAGKTISSFDWDFEGKNNGTYDASGKDQMRPQHTFQQVGKYTTRLRIVDQNNVVENYTRDIDVTLSETPLLSAGIDATPGLSGPIPLQIAFDGSKSQSQKGQITKYDWNFGDGSALQSGRSVPHIYNTPGTYTVTLTVTEDSGKQASTTVQVEAQTIAAPPVAKITTDPAADDKGVVNGMIPFKVSFDGSASTDPDNNIVDYAWDFGDGSPAQSGQKSEYTYEKAGTYTVTLTVGDATKLQNKATITVSVKEPGVQAVIKATPEEGTAPLVIQFDGSGSSTYKGNIVSYEWNFGDNSPTTIQGAQITHKYTNVGTYTVKLKAVTNLNENGTAQKTIYVREVPLKACFTPSRHNGPAPLTVTFDALCSTGAVAKFNWDFGDGGTSDTRKPNHTFDNPGTYNVTLEVSDDKNNVNTFSDVVVAEGQVKADSGTPAPTPPATNP
jgi:PKD repeat protein